MAKFDLNGTADIWEKDTIFSENLSSTTPVD